MAAITVKEIAAIIGFGIMGAALIVVAVWLIRDHYRRIKGGRNDN